MHIIHTYCVVEIITAFYSDLKQANTIFLKNKATLMVENVFNVWKTVYLLQLELQLE